MARNTRQCESVYPYQVFAVLKWLNTEQDSSGEYIPDQMSAKEAVAFVDHVIEKEESEPDEDA